MRRLALPLIAVVLVAAVLGIQVAAGGGHYVPLRPAIRAPGARFPPSRCGSNRSRNRSSCSASRAPHVGSASPASASSSQLAEARSLDPRESAALKTGLVDAVDLLDRRGRLPEVSQLLPQALDQANLPGIVKTIIGAIPDPVVDNLLPTAPLLRRTIDALDINRLLHELNDASQLNSVLQSAILQAALRQILDRLRP